MTFSFHPEAQSEFFDAINYYEECKIGLGYDFSIEVFSTIERIMSFPKAWSRINNEIRRSLIKKFPLVYCIT